MKMRKRIGPRTEPWGTPLRTRARTEWTPLTVTSWERFRRKSLIQSWSFPLTPKIWSFWRSISWSTLSNALAKSRYTTSCSLPSSILWITSSMCFKRWVRQLRPFLKPCWFRDKRFLVQDDQPMISWWLSRIFLSGGMWVISVDSWMHLTCPLFWRLGWSSGFSGHWGWHLVRMTFSRWGRWDKREGTCTPLTQLLGCRGQWRRRSYQFRRLPLLYRLVWIRRPQFSGWCLRRRIWNDLWVVRRIAKHWLVLLLEDVGHFLGIVG